MDHFLSKKEKEDEVLLVELDVSFIREYLNKLHKDLPLEVMLLKFYKMKVNNTSDTLKSFKKYIYNKFKVNNDVELFKILNKNLYLKLTIKIKHTIDSIINREYGCEIYDAKFVDYVVANSEKVIIKIEIRR